jgi:hypothetical protein
MKYFEVTFSNGKTVIACDAPESYVKNCLENTGATFKQTTEERAKEINCYYKVNGGSGWDHLRMHALEANIIKENNTINKIKNML